MKILGIESSCDESAVSIVENGSKVLSSSVASQIDIHSKTGGVVPEVAAREHLINIIPVLDDALKKADISIDDIDAISVTKGPGLVSSLIVGTQVASVLSIVKEKIIIPVHHILGHIYSNWLERDEEDIKFPVIILTVSGGHNELILMKNHNDFLLLGESLDDAGGEAYDKVSRILGLGYPGGPKISAYAEKGDEYAFDFPKAMMGKNSLDFSFSGLKTAVLNEYKKFVGECLSKLEKNKVEKFRRDVASSFQRACNEVLSEKLLLALSLYPEVKEAHLAGGVSANLDLRKRINEKLPKGINFRFPKKQSFCTDNASMIACASYYLYRSDPNKYKKAQNIIPSTSFSF